MAVTLSIVGKFSDKDFIKAEKRLQQLRREAELAASPMARLGKSFDDAGRKMSNMGSSLTRNVTVPLAGAAYAMSRFTAAAADDAKQQVVLATTLRNTAGATDATIAATEAWITAQGKALGVTDDQLRPALGILASATGDVAKAQRLAALSLDLSAARGIDAETAAKALAKAYTGNFGSLSRLVPGISQAAIESGNFTNVQAELAKMVGGTAAKAADTQAGKFQRAKVAMSEATEQVGYAFLPVMEQLSSFLTSTVAPAIERVTNWFRQLSPGMRTGILAAVGLAAAMGPLLMVAGNVTRVFGGFFKVLSFGTAVVRALTGAEVANVAATKTAAAVTKVWTAVQAAFNVVMAANPIVLATLAIAALVAGVVIAYKKFEWFRNIVDAVGRFIADKWKWVAGIILLPIAPILLVISHFDKIKAAFGAVASFIGDKVQSIAGWFGDLPGKLGDIGKRLVEILVAPYRTAFNMIASLWNNTVGRLSFKVPGWVPGIGGKGFDVPDIPMLAAGGVVRRPTLAMIGEAGPEAVVPLDQYRALQRAAAQKDSGFNRMGGKIKSLERWEAKTESRFNKTVTTPAGGGSRGGGGGRGAGAAQGSPILEAIKKQAQDVIALAKEVADSLKSFGSITTYDGQFASAEGITTNMQQRLDAIKTFGKRLRALKDLGLNQTSLQDIIAAGPVAGSQIAEALLKEGKGAISEVNTLEAQIAKSSAEIGSFAAQAQTGMSTKQAETVLNSNINIGQNAIVVNVSGGQDKDEVRTAVAAAVQVAIDKLSVDITDASAKQVRDALKGMKVAVRTSKPSARRGK